jgi:hypothetical protein
MLKQLYLGSSGQNKFLSKGCFWGCNVEIREIIKDSFSYPLSNWKSFLILGIIYLIINLYSHIWSFSPDTAMQDIMMTSYIQMIAEFVTGILALGYLIKVFKSTVDSENILPEFNGWLNIILDGFKASVVVVVYAILFAILLVLVLIFYLLINQGFNSGDFLGLSTSIAPIYTIVIIPVIALALANMAFDERLRSAFSFGEILGDLREIGWGNLIALYLLFGLIYIALRTISIGLSYLLGWADPFLVNLDWEMSVLATIVKSLIFIPYFYILGTRAFALVYMSRVVETS